VKNPTVNNLIFVNIFLYLIIIMGIDTTYFILNFNRSMYTNIEVEFENLKNDIFSFILNILQFFYKLQILNKQNNVKNMQL
jgi:hypothetical protein